MSMIDSMFNKGFKASKCKTLLKLTIPRIKLLRNRREIQMKQMRQDIAKLLETGQEATACIRVEHILREENMMAAQEMTELFCELVVVRLPIIEAQRECPLDLKEAISSICFAAPRCADLPELLQVQMLFASKYGKEFVSAATELLPDCGVNRQLIEFLSIRPPTSEKKLMVLKEIAEEHALLDWDPAASETQLFKTHQDLLNGPMQFLSGLKLPLPEEKRDFEKDNILDLPEVPSVLMRPQPTAGSEPDVSQPTLPSDSHLSQNHHCSCSIVEEETGTIDQTQLGLGSSSLVERSLQEVVAAAVAAAETAERAAKAARSAANLAQAKISEHAMKSNLLQNLFHGRAAAAADDDDEVEVPACVPHFDKLEEEHVVGAAHLPDRLGLADHEPCVLYPNLFSQQNSFSDP